MAAPFRGATLIHMRARVRDVGLILGLASLYVIFARLGLSLGTIAGFATFVWPPTGIAIAALLLIGTRAWPGIFLGAFTANLLSSWSVLVALSIGAGNTAEALICVYIFTRVPNFSLRLENVRSVTALILGAVIGSIVSASVGAMSLRSGGIIPDARVGEVWRAWWVGNVVGALVVAPVILVWSKRDGARFSRGIFETTALMAAVVVVAIATFFGDLSFVAAMSTPFHQADVLLAVLVWAALRFGQRGAATATFWTSATAITATVLGHGPFAQYELTKSLLSLQTFMAGVAVTFLLFGAAINELWYALKDAREASHAAEVANRAKSEFLAVISHELRTPLNAIAGYAQLLEEGVFGRLNEKQVDGVTRIHRNEKLLHLLVDEVLGFVSAEKGELSTEREPVRVADAFDAIQPLMAPQLEEHHSVIERSAIRQGLMVRADPKSLQQILMRLLSNASKFGKDGGRVTLGADREGDVVRIWVRDDGAGISREEIDRVFEPFFQSDHAMTRRVSGIGLGLTIARDLAHRMDGEVELSSEPGRGTTASVLLPAA
jgi:signal transduction histidine kinase